MKINSMGARAVVAMTLLLAVAFATETDIVQFTGDNFKVTCPDEGILYRDKKNVTSEQTYNSETRGLYICKLDGKESSYIYVKARVCPGCIDLDETYIALAIIVDMTGTIILMIVIFKCTKKKHSAGSTNASKVPARGGGRAPPVPSPDYEPLNPHTRAQDPYAMVNRMG